MEPNMTAIAFLKQETYVRFIIRLHVPSYSSTGPCGELD